MFCLACPVSLPRWICPKHFLRKASRRRHLGEIPESPLLTPFNIRKQWLYFEYPPDVWDPHPVSKAHVDDCPYIVQLQCKQYFFSCWIVQGLNLSHHNISVMRCCQCTMDRAGSLYLIPYTHYTLQLLWSTAVKSTLQAFQKTPNSPWEFATDNAIDDQPQEIIKIHV